MPSMYSLCVEWDVLNRLTRSLTLSGSLYLASPNKPKPVGYHSLHHFTHAGQNHCKLWLFINEAY